MRHQRNHPLHERQGMPNVCQIRKSNWEKSPYLSQRTVTGENTVMVFSEKES